jgi:hypothetical protein
MPNPDAATVRRQILRRLRSGEKVAAIAAEPGQPFDVVSVET